MSVDVGLVALDHVYRFMRIDDQWSVRTERGFSWWLGDLPQQIIASPVKESNGCDVTHLVARTTLLTDVPVIDQSRERVDLFNALGASLSALVLDDDGGLSFVTTAVVHEQVMEFAPSIFSFIATMQAAEAQLKLPHLRQLVEGQMPTALHPVAGRRSEPDDLVNVFDRLIVPAGREPSRWAGPAMLSAKASLDPFSLMVNGSETGLTAEFAYDDLTSLLRFDTLRAHPSLGYGLHVTLTLPTLYPQPPYKEAMALNKIEASRLFVNDFQGAWCVAPGDEPALAYTAFYPNALSRAGMAQNIALKMANRAKSVAEIRQSIAEVKRSPGISSIIRAFGFRKH